MASLSTALERFAGELRSLTSRVSDSVASLKRGADARPHAGVDDFRENLEDLERQVADITAEVQQLERCTTDAVSFEELMGHCLELYQSNRAGTLALEAHLEQYGYVRPAGTPVEPAEPCAASAGEALAAEEFVLPDEDAMSLGSPGDGGGLSLRGGAASTPNSPGTSYRPLQPSKRLSRSMPSSPVSAGLSGGSYVPSRLGIGQPGSPMRSAAAAAALGLRGAPAAAPPPATASKAAPGTARCSLGGVSAATLTPEGLSLLSPGLADKYGFCPSSGVPSMPSTIGGKGAPSAQTSGGAPPSPGAAARRSSACRDLRLDYGRCSSDSPNLPIFGKTPSAVPSSSGLPSLPSSGLPSIPSELAPRLHAAAAAAAAPAALDAGAAGPAATAGAAAGAGRSGNSVSPMPDGTDTGDLYEFIIKSNMALPVAEGTHTLTPPAPASPSSAAAAPRDEPRTPRAAAAGAPGDDEARQPVLNRPTTPGRTLPAGWHESALQELDSLTLTLSQLKRTPSRGRLARAASGSSGELAAAAADATGAAAAGGAGGFARSLSGELNSWTTCGGGGGLSAEPSADENVGGTALPPPPAASGAPAPAVLQQRQEQPSSPARRDEGQKKAQATPGTPTTRAALRRQMLLEQQQQQKGGAVAAAAAAVGAAEFAALPAWCSRQLTLDELNAALEGMVARQRQGDGGDAVGLDTLQSLGYDAAKGRAVFNCLSKLGRAQPQRGTGAAGSVAYRLVGPGQ